MIEVSWGDRKLGMFGSDLIERGEENFQAEAAPQVPDFVDPQETRRLLEDAFDAAQQRRIEASKRFTEVMDGIPSGIPQLDGTDRIRMASREYKDSREAATEAMNRLSDFMIRGIVPEIWIESPRRRKLPNRKRDSARQ